MGGPVILSDDLAGTGPLPHPATHQDNCLGGRVGERAGADPPDRRSG